MSAGISPPSFPVCQLFWTEVPLFAFEVALEAAFA
jgi:hypothetical protein